MRGDLVERRESCSLTHCYLLPSCRSPALLEAKVTTSGLDKKNTCGINTLATHQFSTESHLCHRTTHATPQACYNVHALKNFHSISEVQAKCKFLTPEKENNFFFTQVAYTNFRAFYCVSWLILSCVLPLLNFVFFEDKDNFPFSNTSSSFTMREEAKYHLIYWDEHFLKASICAEMQGLLVELVHVPFNGSLKEQI